MPATKTYAAVLLVSSLAGAQPREPAALFRAALRAHVTRPDLPPPQALLIQGTVVRRTREGDENTLRVEQWYRRRDGREELHTRLEVVGVASLTGRPAVTIRGFDGKRHYVLAGKRKIVVDGRADYRQDLSEIRADLERLHLILEAFVLGRLAAPGSTFQDLGPAREGKRPVRRLLRRGPHFRDACFSVNAKAGEPPYFVAIAFPPRQKEPLRTLRFGHFKRFGPYVIPQDVRLYVGKARRAEVSLWLRKVVLNPAAPPAWVP